MGLATSSSTLEKASNEEEEGRGPSPLDDISEAVVVVIDAMVFFCRMRLRCLSVNPPEQHSFLFFGFITATILLDTGERPIAMAFTTLDNHFLTHQLDLPTAGSVQVTA
jgi:hypothetical protein